MSTPGNSIRERLAHFLFADVIERIRAASVSVRIDDSSGWDPLLAGYGPADRPWAERRDDLDDALEAWRSNFYARRIVNLITAYVVGPGIQIGSTKPRIASFVTDFMTHPQNHITQRMGEMCNELTRSGELFPVLFTNKIDGMSYVRFIPASRIREIDTDPDDYEKELRYCQVTNDPDATWWLSPDNPAANAKDAAGELPPVMLHFSINKPIGGTRGEGDLLPVLPWCRRYSEWLADRVRLNRLRTRQGMLDLSIADDTMVEQKKAQLRTDNPWQYGIYVHGSGEELNLHNLQIAADDAEKDGRVLRLAIATGANMALHYLGEGEATNYATAKEMGEPTSRFFSDRQTDFTGMIIALIEAAYRRKVAAGRAAWPADDDTAITSEAPEIARADNASLATAAAQMVTALSEMRRRGWIDDKAATTLALKAAGELISEDDVAEMVDATEPLPEPVPSQPFQPNRSTP